MSPESQEKSEKYLKDLGVKFISNDRVVDYDDDKAVSYTHLDVYKRQINNNNENIRNNLFSSLIES